MLFGGFIRIRGVFAGNRIVPPNLGSEPGGFLGMVEQRPVDVDPRYGVLSRPDVDMRSSNRPKPCGQYAAKAADQYVQ